MCMMAMYVTLFVTICLTTLASGKKRLVLHSDQDILTRFTAMETHISVVDTRLKQVEKENMLLKNDQRNISFLSQHLAELEAKNNQLEIKMKQVQEENALLKNDQGNISVISQHLTELEAKNNQLENKLKGAHGGSTYIRWGRRSCAMNGTTLVYKGYAAGSHYSTSGGGVNTLCLPEDPTWNKYSATERWPAYVYGAEVDASDTKSLFGYNYENQDIPCALCQTDRPRNVMIPGRANCYPGWTQEYTGYLMSGRPTHAASTDYVCLDESPDAVPHGGGSDDEKAMFFVEATCTSLSCPPYVNGRELACVVCSK